ncbi:DNA-primase RepB domain-containing protein [Rubrobacter tropicus]|uniref:DNA-primase RepB domain-containing protein n=1 Tax=Rubrobacter tropicus TaxID=2653851 RepID=UPI00140DB642|nr:DNA-primase RepB domain-containing protein [Rubrobacter tropicus]
MGLETYFCAHLLLAKRRVKANAAPVLALWADADGVAPGFDAPEPTAIVESSPGRAHLFWRLTRSVSPLRAEELNRRLLLAVGADRSGWDLGQLLRPPGTRNRKYGPAPFVRLLELNDDRYHPRELELALPPEEPPRPVSRSGRPTGPYPTPDVSRLSGRMRHLVSRGNRGLRRPYPSRSEADFAVCLAMSTAGYTEAEVWAVMTDSTHGISEKYLEKGRHGDAYLSLTVGKARALARSAG